MNIGKAIKLCRTRRDFTQAELANTIGVTASYISLLERGKRDPAFSTVCNIADALGVPLVILIYIAEGDIGIDKAINDKMASKTLEMLRSA